MEKGRFFQQIRKAKVPESYFENNLDRVNQWRFLTCDKINKSIYNNFWYDTYCIGVPWREDTLRRAVSSLYHDLSHHLAWQPYIFIIKLINHPIRIMRGTKTFKTESLLALNTIWPYLLNFVICVESVESCPQLLIATDAISSSRTMDLILVMSPWLENSSA